MNKSQASPRKKPKSNCAQSIREYGQVKGGDEGLHVLSTSRRPDWDAALSAWDLAHDILARPPLNITVELDWLLL